MAPAVGLPDWTTRWFLVAAVGFPFWIAFAWFYEFTPKGFKREAAADAVASTARPVSRKLDFAMIGVLAIAVVLLLADRLAPRRNAADVALQEFIVEDAENSSMQIASVYAYRKDADKTFEWLEKANTAHDSGLVQMLADRVRRGPGAVRAPRQEQRRR